MSSDEKWKALSEAIATWRGVRDAYPMGSPQYKKYQRKMKEAEWELHRLFSFRFVDPDKPQE